MRGKRRPPEERVSNVAGPLPPCKVCGEQAAGFHYGVNTCEACKGFFRRSLLRNGDYECIGNDNCNIGTNRRKSCPKCRYLKCLKVGMSKEAIKTGRYTYMKRTQDTLEIKKLEESRGLTDTGEISEKLSSMINHSFESYNSPPTTSPYSASSSAETSTEHTASKVRRKEAIYPSGSSGNDAKEDLMTRNDTDISIVISSSSSSSPVPITQTSSTYKPDPDASNSTAPDKADAAKNLSSNISTDSCKMVGSDSSCFLSPASSDKPATPMEYTASSPLACALSVSPPLSAPPSDSSLSWWQHLGEEELNDMISQLVHNHNQFIVDSNSLSEEFFQEQFQKCKEECKLKGEIFGNLGHVTKAEYDHIYNKYGIDVDNRIEEISYCANNMDRDIRQMITFMKAIPGFRSISLRDQTGLVKACIYELFVLSYFRGYNSTDMSVVEASRHFCYHEMTKIYEPEFIEIIFRLTRKLQELDLTFEMIVILKCVCIFFPDRIELDNYEEVQNLHCRMVQCLMLLLYRRWPEKHGIMLSRVINYCTNMRTVDLECRKMWTSMGMENYPPVAARPILTELFSGNVV